MTKILFRKLRVSQSLTSSCQPKKDLPITNAETHQ